jgi:dTDP-4-dehydrorhamnose reductase
MRIVVTGASGQLGSYVLDQLVAGPHEIVAWSGSSMGSRAGLRFRPVDLSDKPALTAALQEADPGVVIHAAAMSSAEAVHRDPARGWAVNVSGTRVLAEWAARHDRRLVFTSTDLVFDGGKSWYREEDPAVPILDYGRTKRAAEPFVLAVPRGLVTRISLLYGPACSLKKGFFDRAMASLRQGEAQTFFTDEFRTPLDYVTAARTLIKLGLSEMTGIIHLGGRERLSRFELMRRAAVALGIDPSLIRPSQHDQLRLAEARPADASLDTSRLSMLVPDLERPLIEAALTSPNFVNSCKKTDVRAVHDAEWKDT